MTSWSAADVLRFFDQKSQPIEKQALLAYKNVIYDALSLPDDFAQVMSLIMPYQRDIIFDLLFPDIISKISCVDDFVKIALYLTPEQKKTLWENIPPLQINSLLELAKLINLLEPSCYPLLLQSCGKLQKTGVEFGMLLGMLSSIKREALDNWILKSLPELIILSSEDFQAPMHYLNNAQKKVLFDRVWLTLPGMIQNSHGFKRVFSCLTPAQSSLLLLSIDLEKICFNTIDKVEVLTSLHKNQLRRLYITFPDNASHWGVILGNLEPEKAQIIMSKFPKNLYNGRSFAELQMLNSSKVRNHLFDLFQHKFSLIVKNVEDFLQVFSYLDGGQKDYLWQRFANELPLWIKQEPAFFRLFANEHPDLFEFFQCYPNHLAFVEAVLSEKPERIQHQFEQLLKPRSKSRSQFFQSNYAQASLLKAIEFLHPRRAAILNQALNLHLNKVDLLSVDAFMEALGLLINIDNAHPSISPERRL